MLGRKPKEKRGLRVVAAVAFVVMVTVNALANILPINGQTSGEVSDKYANLFAPAGFTFAIWSVIYLLLAAYTVYQLVGLKGKSQLKPEVLNRVTPHYIASSLLNAVWIFAWHYEVIWLSVILIAGILFTLIRINTILDENKKYTSRERLLVRAPFSVYFGWITVATIANVTTWLVSVKWDGWGWNAEQWTVTMLTVGVLIALATMYRFRDVLYGLVIIWAYVGILAKHLMDSGWGGDFPMVIGSLVSLLAILALYALYLTYTEYDFPKKLV